MAKIVEGREEPEINGASLYGVILYYRETFPKTEAVRSDSRQTTGPFPLIVASYSSEVDRFCQLTQRYGQSKACEDALRHGLYVYAAAMQRAKAFPKGNAYEWLNTFIARLNCNGLRTLADYYAQSKRYADAKEAFEVTISTGRKTLSRSDPEFIDGLNDYGEMLFESNDLTSAEHYFLEAREILADQKNPDVDQEILVLGNLVNLYTKSDRLAAGESLSRMILGLEEDRYGDDSPKLYDALDNIAILCRLQNKQAEAAAFLERAIAVNEASRNIEELQGQARENEREALQTLSQLYAEQANKEAAQKVLLKLISLQQSDKPVSTADLASSYGELGTVYALWKKYDKSIESIKHAIDLRHQASMPEDLEIVEDLGRTYDQDGLEAEAEQTFKHALEIAQARNSEQDELLASAAMAIFYYRHDRFQQSDPMMRDWISRMKKINPADRRIPEMETWLHDHSDQSK